ncbi:hypothetical protein AAG906_005891 [Vitis piasezkii]
MNHLLLHPPAVEDPKYESREDLNSIVMSWLLHLKATKHQKNLSPSHYSQGNLGGSHTELHQDLYDDIEWSLQPILKNSKIWLEREQIFQILVGLLNQEYDQGCSHVVGKEPLPSLSDHLWLQKSSGNAGNYKADRKKKVDKDRVGRNQSTKLNKLIKPPWRITKSPLSLPKLISKG